MNTVHACDRYCYFSPEVEDCFPSTGKCKQWITTLNTSRSDDLSKSVLQQQRQNFSFLLNQKLQSFPQSPCASLKLKCPKCRCRWRKHVHKKMTVWFHRVNCRNISPLTACRNSYCIVESQSILQKIKCPLLSEENFTVTQHIEKFLHLFHVAIITALWNRSRNILQEN